LRELSSVHCSQLVPFRFGPLDEVACNYLKRESITKVAVVLPKLVTGQVPTIEARGKCPFLLLLFMTVFLNASLILKQMKLFSFLRCLNACHVYRIHVERESFEANEPLSSKLIITDISASDNGHYTCELLVNNAKEVHRTISLTAFSKLLPLYSISKG
jgi:hypothetical protein